MKIKYKVIKENQEFNLKINDIIKIDKLDNRYYYRNKDITNIMKEYFEMIKESKFKYSIYSYSKIDLWKSCPKKFKFNYIDKIQIPKIFNPITERGTLIHSILEFDLIDNLDNYVSDEKYQLSEEEKLKAVNDCLFFMQTPLYKEIKNLKGKPVTEQEFFLDSDLKPTLNANKSAVKGFIDAIIVNEDDKICYIFDWKTGGTKEKLKKYPRSSDQLELYIIWAFQVFNVDTIKAAYIYVDLEHKQEFEYSKRDLNFLKEKFIKKIEQIEADNKFDYKFSKLCAWCAFKEHCLGIPLTKEPREITDLELEMAQKAIKNKEV